MKPRILLVNPPIYDFAAHDFWLRPYGLLRVAGYLRDQAELRLFDYLDPLEAQAPRGADDSPDRWGRCRIRLSRWIKTGSRINGSPHRMNGCRNVIGGSMHG